jgi:hypothetical protein
MVVDARVEAAVALAEDEYEQTMKASATIVAIAIGLIVGIVFGAQSTGSSTNQSEPEFWKYALGGLLIGVAAVPLAPVANDVANAIQSAAQALKLRKPQP